MARSSSNPEKQIASVLHDEADSLCAISDMPHKRVGNTRYFHLVGCGFQRAAKALSSPLRRITGEIVSPDDLIAKVDGDGCLSVLLYSDFFSRPHPELLVSARYDAHMHTVRIRRYKTNPPILHRKELLLSPDHAHYGRAQAFTISEQQAGLLDPPFDFGFRKQWEERLRSTGYFIDGYTLRRLSPS